MNKRLRKKKRVGEFVEYGFDLYFKTAYEQDDEASKERFWDLFVKFIESCDLGVGGATNVVWDVFVTKIHWSDRRKKHGTCTEEDREKVQQWLERHPDVSDIKLGPLVDCWES